MDIELEDNKQFISNIPCIYIYIYFFFFVKFFTIISLRIGTDRPEQTVSVFVVCFFWSSLIQVCTIWSGLSVQVFRVNMLSPVLVVETC